MSNARPAGNGEAKYTFPRAERMSSRMTRVAVFETRTVASSVLFDGLDGGDYLRMPEQRRLDDEASPVLVRLSNSSEEVTESRTRAWASAGDEVAG